MLKSYAGKTGEVTGKEWRWVIILGGLLVTLTLLPYAWALNALPAGSSLSFMGILYNPQDGATYLAKIGQGQRGLWQFVLMHTPEAHEGAFINTLYLLLGHIAKFLGLSNLLMFHLARLAAGFFMYIAIYHLGSAIFARVRSRRLFFGLMAIGSGFGWLVLVISPLRPITQMPIDLSVPEAIPFYATLVNPHFPLSIGLLCLLTATFITVFRPGFKTEPSMINGPIGITLIAAILVFIQPQAWLPFAASLAVYIGIVFARTRIFPALEVRWATYVFLPAIPILAYFFSTIASNPSFRAWNEQNVTLSPTPDSYALGYGMLLLVAVPGIWRAVRRFERDGDRFMLIWLIVNMILLYMPFNLQRRLAIGLIIPIVYFCTRSFEDFWFARIKPSLRGMTMIVFFVALVPSNVLIAGLPLFGVLNPKTGMLGEAPLVLDSGYANAIRWLKDNGRADEVVLAPRQPSLWIPAYSDLRVVYGHQFETLQAAKKLAEVRAWYLGNDCQGLISRYRVKYILTKESEPDDEEPSWPTECLKELSLTEPVQRYGKVSIYKVP